MRHQSLFFLNNNHHHEILWEIFLNFKILKPYLQMCLTNAWVAVTLSRVAVIQYRPGLYVLPVSYSLHSAFQP